MKRRKFWAKDYVPQPKRKANVGTPRRKFTDHFSINDEVAIIRFEHGWLDGRVTGRIISISNYHCVVSGNDGGKYDIDCVRDIRKIRVVL